MDEAWLGTAIGSAVLLFAAIFVFGHYRREHRRTQLLRQLESVVCKR
jgi:integral membrane sensor domain MASE1